LGVCEKQAFEAASTAIRARWGNKLVELDPTQYGTIEQVVRSWQKDLPDLDIGAFSVQLKLYQINLIASRIYNGIADDFSLNDVDVSVLMIILREREDRPVRPSDLWKLLRIAPSAITYRLDRLNELGLIERIPDQSDRRALFLQLTDQGRNVVREIVMRFNKATAKRLAVSVENGCDLAELDKQLNYVLDAWSEDKEQSED